MSTRRLIGLVLLFAVGCGKDTVTQPPDVSAVNLGGTFEAVTMNGTPPPISLPVDPDLQEQVRIGKIEGATLFLIDEAEDPEVPDPARLEWFESITALDGSSRFDFHVMVDGTFVAWPDSVVFDWVQPVVVYLTYEFFDGNTTFGVFHEWGQMVDGVATRGDVLTLRFKQWEYPQSWIIAEFQETPH